MITSRLPEPPRCQYPCARCGEPPAQYLPKKTKKQHSRCERCGRFDRAVGTAWLHADFAREEFASRNGTENDPRRIVRKLLGPLTHHAQAAEAALEAAELARDPVVGDSWVKFAATHFRRIGRLHSELKEILDLAPAVLELGPRRKGLVLVRGGRNA